MKNLIIKNEKKINERIGKYYKDTRPQRIKKNYVNDLLYSLEDLDFKIEDLKKYYIFQKKLLNGANNWIEYSWGGCSLCYNYDIVERLELKQKWDKYDGDKLLNEQARYLKLASIDLFYILEEVFKNE